MSQKLLGTNGMQPGYTEGQNNLKWVTDRKELVIMQTPDCCQRQKFKIYDANGDKRQVMRTDTDCGLCDECFPADARVLISKPDGTEIQTHKIISSDTGCCKPKWKLTDVKTNQQLGYASLPNGCMDLCGCPPSLKMGAEMTSGSSTFFAEPKNPPQCCDGMCCPGTRYDFDIKNTRGRHVATGAKLPLNSFAAHFMGINNYSLTFEDPNLSADEKGVLLTMIFAADFHYWKPKNNNN